MQTSDEEIQKLREHILAEIDLTREMSDTEIRAIVSEKCSIYGKQKFLKLSEQEALEQYLFHSLRKLDVLQELLDDPEITEIMVNGAEHIFYEKRGQLFESDKHFTSKEKLNDVIQQMAGSNNRMVNEASPIVDTRLANGSRVNIVLQPIAIDGSAISIRKFPEQPFVMEDLIRFGAITEEAAEFLKVLVLSGYNIFVSGGTGSGKTTFLYAISGMLDNLKGEIYIEEKNILACTKKEREKIRLNDISIIFQNLNLFSFMNVEDNILLPYYIKERTVNEKTCQLMNEYLTIMNLAGINKRDIHSLSGGEQQRVAIVRSILDSTKIILCDEPTASLDRKNTEIFMKTLVDITQKRNVAVMIVTHDENVVKYGTAKYYMEDGKIRKYK